MAGEIRVRGYREFIRACKFAEADTRKEVRGALRTVGDIVRVEAVGVLEHYSPKSARGLKVRVRQRGVAVEQSLRKTTGKHPEWGAFQMRSVLIPARKKKSAEVTFQFEQALGQIANHFERR